MYQKILWFFLLSSNGQLENMTRGLGLGLPIGGFLHSVNSHVANEPTKITQVEVGV